MALNDVYMITLNYTWGDVVDCKNVFYYQQTDSNASGAEQLNTAMAIDVTEKILDVAPEFCTFQTQEVVNLRNPADFYLGDYADNEGDRVVADTDPAPPFLAAQWVSARAFPGTRSARKRFPFLYETDLDGRFLSTSFSGLASVTALSAALAAVISYGGRTFRPVVVERPTPLGSLPTVRYVIAPGSYGLNTRVSTQNSRKD
ncbi:MAG TPA: hypothetical protein VJ843_00455 [Candidatus Saccharimonadales bacterium]|nr:hypothetical protein [Candidatus Saccharimonadales bacterium]